MDIKFFLILAILLLVTMYFINEFKLLRTYIIESSEANTKLIKSKYNSIVNDIKDINFDLVNQTKKINKIHSQKITTMSNYFTESETDGNNLLNYLSDTKTNKKNITSTDNNFKINFNTSPNDTIKDTIKDTNKELLEKIIVDETGNEHKFIKQTNDNDLISISEHDVNEHDELQNNIEDILKNINNDNVNDNVNENLNYNLNENLNENLNGRLDIHESDNNSDGSRTSKSCKSESSIIIETNEKDNDKSSSSGKNNIEETIEINNINNNINNDINEKHSVDLSTNSGITKISIKNKEIKSLHDAISFGSKKKGKNIMISHKNDKTDLDLDSLVTGEIMKLNKLNPIESYNIKQLQKIASILTIPIKYKDGKKNITYKKEELYLKIKDEINKKSIQ